MARCSRRPTEAAAETQDARAGEYDARLRRSYIEDGGMKPLGVLLSELRDADLSADEFMKAARAMRRRAARTRRVRARRVVRGGARQGRSTPHRLPQVCQGAAQRHGLRPEDAHIDALFPRRVVGRRWAPGGPTGRDGRSPRCSRRCMTCAWRTRQPRPPRARRPRRAAARGGRARKRITGARRRRSGRTRSRTRSCTCALPASAACLSRGKSRGDGCVNGRRGTG